LFDETGNGFVRGADPIYFNETNFYNLPGSLQEKICQVPMANRPFFFVILWLWLTVVLSYLRILLNLIWRFSFAMKPGPEDEKGVTILRHRPNADGDNIVVVRVASNFLRSFMIIGVLIPRIVLVLIIAHTGTRWLTATYGYGDVMFNSLALAFILELGTLVFSAVIPFQNQLFTTETCIPHIGRMEAENLRTTIGTFFLSWNGCGSFLDLDARTLVDGTFFRACPSRLQMGRPGGMCKMAFVKP
jgi:hypothetical protein